MECPICEKEMSKTKLYSHFLPTHNITYPEYRILHIGNRFCKQCNDDINHKHFNSDFCNKKCRKLFYDNELIEKSKLDTTNTIECKICGFKCKTLMSHLNIKHNITLPEYQQKYKLTTEECYDTKYLSDLSEAVKGDKNPAYQHGGKFSPFSKKFIKYETDEEYEIGFNNVQIKNSISQKENGNNSTTMLYWINRGYTQEEAIKMISERQMTFSLDKCIEKHGEEQGRIVWQERQDKWQASINDRSEEDLIKLNKSKQVTLAKFIKKHGDIIGRDKWNKLIEVKKYKSSTAYYVSEYGEERAKEILQSKCRTTSNKYYSKISQKLFWEVCNLLPDTLYNQIMFAELNAEYTFYDKINYKWNMYDFIMTDLKFCIEFNGDYWHCNPSMFSPEDVISMNGGDIVVEDIWAKDVYKNKLLEREGYDVMIIWEWDYNNNKDEVINKILNKIKNKIKVEEPLSRFFE